MLAGRTVLVTGGTGFIGSHLVDELAARGVKPRCLVRRLHDLRYLNPQSADLFQGDLLTGAGLGDALAGADVIFHLAGVTKGLASSDYYNGNVRSTETLLRQAPPAARILHVSSLAAVGPSPDGKPLSEDAPLRPLTHYGRSKQQAEELVRRFRPDAIIVRPPVVYGPRDHDVFQAVRSVSRGVFLKIGRGESYFSIIHVRDLVTGLIAAATKAPPGATYFLANERPLSWTEFGDTVANVSSRRVRYLTVPGGLAMIAGWCAEQSSRLRGKPGILSRDKVLEARQRAWICDPSRARVELGFEAAVSFTDGMRETIAWYRENGWLR